MRGVIRVRRSRFSRTLAFVFVLATTGAVDAQAPGEVTPSAPASTVLARRWAVTLGFGSLGLKPRRDGADNVAFGMVELGGRFRVIPTLEVGLSLFGGGAMKGDITTGGLFIDGRYRFMADRPWNVFVSLGLGVVSVAGKEASDDEKRGRGAMRIGVGVERRFRALAIDAQLRLVGIGENTELTALPAPTQSYELAKSRLSGGSLTVDGTFYF